MKSPIFQTLIMAVVALVASGVAASFYPWPEPVIESEIIGTNLFESYDTTAVRSIKITQFNADRNSLDRMVLRRSGEKWIIPENKKFIATNTGQISAAANSLNDVPVLVEKTDEQQAYPEYGVVDPDEYQNTTNRSGLGTKIILEDRNGKSLASLIVGKPLKDESDTAQHFVRIPGQPNVYVIKFDRNALNTDFRSWVDSNLMELSNQVPIEQILVENYQFDPSAGLSTIQRNYRAALEVVQQGIQLESVEIGGADKSWEKISIPASMNQPMLGVVQQMIDIQFTDVRRKSEELTKLFSKPNQEANDFLLGALKPLGFVKTGFENGNYTFDSSGGELVVKTKDGVVVTLYVGTIAEKTNTEDLDLSYNVMVMAGVDPAIVPEPEKPESDEDPVKAEQQEKAYLRLVDQRNIQIKSAEIRAAEFNQRHAEWVYIVSETVIDKLLPDVNLEGASAPNPLTKSISEFFKATPEASKK